jgi:beta-lactamase class D
MLHQIQSRRKILSFASGALSMLVAPSALLAHAPGLRIERPDLMEIFASAGAVGAMVVYLSASKELIVINATRAEQRFIPASTFKLANSLIALETNAVKDENEIIPFGGKPQPVKAWERDMSMREALPISNVAIFQELARRIGLSRYKEWLTRLDYGNQETGTVVDRFWLNGPLRTSAVEQARFAAKLANKELPLSERSQSIVRDICRLEQSGTRALFGKTGWTGSAIGIGWLTGWVEEAGASPTSFSINIDMPAMADAPKRLAITKAVLARLEKY